MSDFAVLFVCTGNICRSPTAHAVLRHRLQEAGLADRVRVESAGTTAYHVGEPPDRRAQAAALSRGVRMDDLAAQPVRESDYTQFDLILAMDAGHMRALIMEAPRGATADMRLFTDFAPVYRGEDVPDPYYGAQDGFETVLDMIYAGTDGLLAHIRTHLAE